jgi:hypothetical protein
MGASDEQLFSSTTGRHFANNIAGGRTIDRNLRTGYFSDQKQMDSDCWGSVGRLEQLPRKYRADIHARFADWQTFCG